jgi:hypothetical protein
MLTIDFHFILFFVSSKKSGLKGLTKGEVVGLVGIYVLSFKPKRQTGKVKGRRPEREKWGNFDQEVVEEEEN